MLDKIKLLHNEGKSYNEISKLLNISKSTISYYNKRYGFIVKKNKKLSDINIDDLNAYYVDHTIKECVEKFGLSSGTLKTVLTKKRVFLSEEEKKEQNYERVKSFRQRNKIRAVEYKGGKCVRCSYNKSIRALEFHHLNPIEKDFHISHNMNLSWEKIKKEIDKCILVCSNCHREIHGEIDEGIFIDYSEK